MREVVTISLQPLVADRLREDANKAGMNISAYIAFLIMQAKRS